MWTAGSWRVATDFLSSLCIQHHDRHENSGTLAPTQQSAIAQLVTKGPNLDQASAEHWAREIQDQALRQSTLQELFKAGRWPRESPLLPISETNVKKICYLFRSSGRNRV